MYVIHAIAEDPSARAPGQHARALVQRLRLRTLLALGFLAVATALLGRELGLHSVLFLASEVALLAAMFVVSRYVMPLLERHDRGATGEEQVGSLLDGLEDRGWQAIHDASLGNGNVDHILIGPAGVFTVETKSHAGPVRVSRIHGATFAQAQAQRRAIAHVTGLPVEPLLVYSRAWVDRPLARRRGVRVLPARMLPAYLERQHTTLTPEEAHTAHGHVARALRQHRASRLRRRQD
ncbi:MAG TPA: nuclease-related domain-containing protein [Solirubrobacteraceae bacterium]|nr:nuclease-related domain-containing protein [Solirubrobacteraceae bacterium]